MAFAPNDFVPCPYPAPSVSEYKFVKADTPSTPELRQWAVDRALTIYPGSGPEAVIDAAAMLAYFVMNGRNL